jgi:hypothetical protein
MIAIDLERWRNIATVAAAGIAAVAAAIAFFAALQALRTVRLKSVLDMFDLLEGADGGMRKLRLGVAERVKEAKRKDSKAVITDLTAADPSFRADVELLARSCDKVGLLVKLRLIPADLLFDFYSRPIIQAWRDLKPYVDSVRVDREQPGHMLKFQVLAIGAALARAEKYPADPLTREVLDAADRGDRGRWCMWRPRETYFYPNDWADDIAERLDIWSR